MTLRARSLSVPLPCFRQFPFLVLLLLTRGRPRYPSSLSLTSPPLPPSSPPTLDLHNLTDGPRPPPAHAPSELRLRVGGNDSSFGSTPLGIECRMMYRKGNGLRCTITASVLVGKTVPQEGCGERGSLLGSACCFSRQEDTWRKLIRPNVPFQPERGATKSTVTVIGAGAPNARTTWRREITTLSCPACGALGHQRPRSTDSRPCSRQAASRAVPVRLRSQRSTAREQMKLTDEFADILPRHSTRVEQPAYTSMLAARRRLPMYRDSERVLAAISAHAVCPPCGRRRCHSLRLLLSRVLCCRT